MNQTINNTLKHLSRYVQMVHRCYNTSCKAYASYGAKGVTICKEWLDSPDAFILWCNNNGYKEGLVPDKDILCDTLHVYPKIYSPTTCKFITEEENREYMLANIIRRPVACYDKTGKLIATYRSVSEAGTANQATNISRAIRGERRTALGMYWVYLDDINTPVLTISIPEAASKGKAIVEVDSNGAVLASFKNAVEAASVTGLRPSAINQVANGHRNKLFGRIFKYQ